jgi:putrescine aminotransferase
LQKQQLGAIELVKNKATRERYPSETAVGMICRGHCFDNGLIMRAVGDTMIISPPLVISKAEIDELVDKARKCLDLTAEALRG